MNLSAVLSLALLLAATPVVHAENADSVPVAVSIDVPNPNWSIKIQSMYTKDEKLLVVCKASQAEGMAASVISKAEDSAKISKELAKLPREIYLLGCGWKWGKGYTAVTEAELEKALEGSKMIYTAPSAKAAEVGAKSFVGLTLEEAEALAKKHKISYRVVMVDGKPRPATRDYRPDRLNFTIVKGKITKVSKG